MNSRDFERTLEKLTGYPGGQIDQRMRGLRDLGLLPIGGRGPYAPEIETVHAALMVLQMVALRATDALAVGVRAMNLELLPVPGEPDAFFGATVPRLSLGAAVAYLLNHPSEKWYRLEIESDGRRAYLTVDRGGEAVDLVFVEDPAKAAAVVAGDLGRYRNQGATSFGHRFVMGAGQVKQLALKLNPDAARSEGRDEIIDQFRALLASGDLAHVAMPRKLDA